MRSQFPEHVIIPTLRRIIREQLGEDGDLDTVPQTQRFPAVDVQPSDPDPVSTPQERQALRSADVVGMPRPR